MSKKGYNKTRERNPGSKRRYSPEQEIAITPRPKTVEAFLDEKALDDAIETAEAMTDEEQAVYEQRQYDLRGLDVNEPKGEDL